VQEQHGDTTSKIVPNEHATIHEPTFQEFSFVFSEENLSMVQ